MPTPVLHRPPPTSAPSRSALHPSPASVPNLPIPKGPTPLSPTGLPCVSHLTGLLPVLRGLCPPSPERAYPPYPNPGSSCQPHGLLARAAEFRVRVLVKGFGVVGVSLAADTTGCWLARPGRTWDPRPRHRQHMLRGRAGLLLANAQHPRLSCLSSKPQPFAAPDCLPSPQHARAVHGMRGPWGVCVPPPALATHAARARPKSPPMTSVFLLGARARASAPVSSPGP